MGEPPSMNCRQKNCFNIADFESAISPSSELQFGWFFFWIWVIFRKESRFGLFFAKFFYQKFQIWSENSPPKNIYGFCGRLLQNIETEICFKPSFPWRHNLNLIPLIRILGGGPKDLKSWNRSDKICKIRMPEKKREHKENKTTKKLVLLKQRIIVEATLWRTICPFTKWGLLFIAFFEIQYHRWIPWANTMGRYHLQYHG